MGICFDEAEGHETGNDFEDIGCSTCSGRIPDSDEARYGSAAAGLWLLTAARGRVSSICGHLAANYGLYSLREPGRELPAALYSRETAGAATLSSEDEQSPRVAETQDELPTLCASWIQCLNFYSHLLLRMHSSSLGHTLRISARFGPKAQIQAQGRLHDLFF